MMKKFLVVLAAMIGGLVSAVAGAATYNFTNITNNTSVNLGSQLQLTVDELLPGQATFLVQNLVGTASNVAEIYFDYGDPSQVSSFALTGQSGATFQAAVVNPDALPGGNTVGFSTDYGADSDCKSLGCPNSDGLNKASDWVNFTATLTGTFQNLLASIDAGNFRVGLHVRSIGTTGQSDSYVTGGRPPVVPLPAAAWLFGSALLGFVALSRRRRV